MPGEADRIPFAIALSGEISVEQLPEVLAFLGQLGVTPKVWAQIGENKDEIEDTPIYRSDVEQFCEEHDVYPTLVNKIWGALTTSEEITGIYRSAVSAKGGNRQCRLMLSRASSSSTDQILRY